MTIRVRLICEDVQFDDIDFRLTQDSQILGRSVHSDVQIVHPLISRQHCQCLIADGEVFLRDLDSTNQTIVNGQPIEESRLQPGDRLLLGDLEFVVEISRIEDEPPIPVPTLPLEDSPNDRRPNTEMPTTRLKSQAVSAGDSNSRTANH